MIIIVIPRSNIKELHLKKLLILFILSTISTTALAEWTLIQTNDDGNMYVDFDSLQKSGNTVTVFTLNDFYALQANDALSTKWQEVHDCKSKRFKPIAITYYSKNMGQGNVIESRNFEETKTDWSDVAPYSIGELKTNIICSK